MDAPAGSPIDFEKYIGEKAAGFTGRLWVFREIDAWLQNNAAPRVFLLTGEPGGGKSAIAAQLVRMSTGAAASPPGMGRIGARFLDGYHFCNARELRWTNPLTFSHSLALQLSQRFAEFAQALIETSSQGKYRIDGTATVGVNTGGQVAGNWINTLNIQSMPSQTAFGALVREPLERLLAVRPGLRLVFLVDAIDESLIFSGDDGILTLIARAEELQSVRFILTSRQDSRVETQFPAAAKLFLSADQHQAYNKADIGAFVRARLPAQTASAQVVEEIADKAAGNFQYVTFLLDTMERGHLSLADVRGLPTGLDDLYHRSIELVVKIGKKDWASSYAPILGAMSVARQSLTSTELQNFTAQTESQVLANLNDLEQFVRESVPADPQGDSTYRIFHQSFVDMLGTKRIGGGANKNLYYIPPSEQHQRIVDYYRQGRSCATISWTEIDDYGLLHLPSHAYALRTTTAYKTALFDMISASLLWARWSRYRTHRLFADDVRLLLAAANSQTPADTVLQIRGSLILTSLSSMAAQTPPDAIRALALAGFFPQAYGHASLIPETEARQRALLMIHAAMPAADQDARDSFFEACTGLLPANLAAAAPALAAYGELERIAPVLALTSGEARARLEFNLVASLCDAQQCDAALGIVDSIADPGDQVRALSRVLAGLPPTSPQGPTLAARALAVARSMTNAESRAAALSFIAEGLSRSARGTNASAATADAENATQVALEALKTLEAIALGWPLMTTLCRLAPVLKSAAEFQRLCGLALRIADQEAVRIEAEASAPVAAAASSVGAGAQSLVARTDAAAAQFMARRLTGLNVISAVPEVGLIVILGGLGREDIRANAINWIAQTIAAEHQQPAGIQIAAQLQRALDVVAPGGMGVKQVARGYAALILAQAGESGLAKALIDAIFVALRQNPVTPEIYKQLLIAIGPALALADDLAQALSVTDPIKDPKNANGLDEIWVAIAGRLDASARGAKVLSFLRLIGSDETRAKVMLGTIRTLSDTKEHAARNVLGALGEIDNCPANALPPGPRLKVLAAVAARFGELGEPGRAVVLALRVIEATENPSDSEAKARCQAGIAQSLAGTGEAAQAIVAAQAALTTAGTNTDSVIASVDAIRALARLGQFADAVAALDALADDWKNKSCARRDVAVALAQAGHTERAVKLVGLIDDRALHAQALIAIAEILLENKAADDAAQLAAQALDLLNKTDRPTDAREGPHREQTCIGEFVETGPAGWKALRILCNAGKAQEASAIVQAMEDPETSTDVLHALNTALGFFVCGSTDRALALAEHRLKQSPLLVRSDSRLVMAWGRAAILEVLAGRFERAADIVRTILITENGSNDSLNQMDESVRLNAVLELARVCEEEGHDDWAAKFLDSASVHAQQLSYAFIRIRFGGQIIVAYVRIGLQERGAALWQELLTAAQSSGRLAVFDIVRYGAPLLARHDDGRTLWSVFQTIQEVEGWWKVPDELSPTADRLKVNK